MNKTSLTMLIVLLFTCELFGAYDIVEYGDYPCGSYTSGNFTRRYNSRHTFEINGVDTSKELDDFVFELNEKKIKLNNGNIVFEYKSYEIKSKDTISNSIEIELVGETTIKSVKCVEGDDNFKFYSGMTYYYHGFSPYKLTTKDNILLKNGELEMVFKMEKDLKPASLEIITSENSDLNLGVGVKGGELNEFSPGYSPGKIRVKGAYRSFVKIDCPGNINIYHSNGDQLTVYLTPQDERIILNEDKHVPDRLNETTGKGNFIIDGKASVPTSNAAGEYNGQIDISVYYEE